MRKRVILSAVFLAALWLPILQMNLRIYREFDNPENRQLAEPPRFGLSEIKKWPSECDAYVSDHFGMRPDLIRWNNILRVRLLGVSPVDSVILGKDSWLFYRSEALHDGDTMNDYRGDVPLPDEELARMEHILEENRREFSANGIVYLVVIAPNKNSVYGEYLPDEIEKLKSASRLDQLMAQMKSRSEVEILDLREALIRAKEEYPVYGKTDSHWNSYGAFVGYREIIRHLSTRLPDIQMDQPSIDGGRVAVERHLPGGDLLQMLFMQDLVPEDNHTRFNLAKLPDAPPLNTLVFRHDSFGDNLYPFLRTMFREIINIAPFDPFDFDAIKRQRPDVVLHVFAERYLPQAVHGDFYYKAETSASTAGM